MPLTLTEVFTEIGTWPDDSGLVDWVTSQHGDQGAGLLLPSVTELVGGHTSYTSEHVDTVLADFAQHADQLDLLAFFINVSAVREAIFSLPSTDGRLSEEKKQKLLTLFTILAESSSPLRATGMQELIFWVRDSGQVQWNYSRAVTQLRGFLQHQGNVIKAHDPALWVVLVQPALDINLPLPIDDPDFNQRKQLIDGLLHECATHHWITPCESVIYQILEDLIESDDGPLHALAEFNYHKHFSWISTVCDHVANSDNDREGLASIWEATLDIVGKPE